MKISKKQQQLNREAVLNCAASLTEEMDFSKVTYKDLAEQTELSQQGIYKYFPNKNAILKEYMIFKISSAINAEENIDAQSMDERFELFCLNFFEEIGNHVKMLNSVLDVYVTSPISLSEGGLQEGRSEFISFMRGALDKDMESTNAIDLFVTEALWDAFIGLCVYWCRDDSLHKRRSEKLLSMTVSIMKELINTEIPKKIAGMFQFLVREHVFSKFHKLDELLDLGEKGDKS